MPGHKAKLLAFFTVIDEVGKIYPYQIIDLSSINGHWIDKSSNTWFQSLIIKKKSN